MTNEVQAVISLLDRAKIFQRVNREWRPHLSATERDFLFYLLDNTIAWGRYSLQTTIDQIVKGTSWGLPPSGLSRSTVCRLLRVFKERGLIDSASDGRKTTLTINEGWTPSGATRCKKEAVGMSDNRRKRAKTSRFSTEFSGDIDISDSVSERDFRSVRKRLQKCQRDTLNNRKREREAKKSNDAARRPVLADLIDKETGKILPRPNSSTASRKESPWSVWSEAWVATFPDTPCPAWKQYESRHMDRLCQKSEKTGINWADFVNWSVCHWASIRISQFSWMVQTPPPAFPTVGFFIRFSDRFADAYANRQLIERQSKDFSSDAAIKKLMHGGMSYEAALVEYGKQLAIAEQREQLDKQRKEIALLERTAERMRQNPQPVRKTHQAVAEVRVSHGDNPFDKADPVSLDDGSDLNWDESIPDWEG